MPGSVIDYPGEVETWTPVHLYPGINYLAYAMGASSSFGSLADPALVVYDTYQNIAVAEDTNLSNDAWVSFQVPYEGDFAMDVYDASGYTGSYTANLIFDPGGYVPVTDPSLYGPHFTFVDTGPYIA
jgi:hypothetical protein